MSDDKLKHMAKDILEIKTEVAQIHNLVNFISRTIDVPKDNNHNKNHDVISIALDYDGTVTSDPVGFLALVKLLRSRGHHIRVVTMRYESECFNDPDFISFSRECGGFIATGRKAKRPHCASVGHTFHIWIDDNPEAVYKTANEIWGTSSPEGCVVIEKHSI